MKNIRAKILLSLAGFIFISHPAWAQTPSPSAAPAEKIPVRLIPRPGLSIQLQMIQEVDLDISFEGNGTDALAGADLA